MRKQEQKLLIKDAYTLRMDDEQFPKMVKGKFLRGYTGVFIYVLRALTDGF